MNNLVLDQHFLIDKSIISKIISSANLKQEDVILEVGAGKGVLTKELSKECEVIAIEIDPANVNYLKGHLRARLKDNVTIIEGNALSILKRDLKFNKIISNLPYGISEPFFKLLFKLKFEFAELMIGERFYNSLMSNTKLGVLTRSCFEIKKLISVPPSAFDIPPKTNSVVISLVPKSYSDFFCNLSKHFNKLFKNAIIQSLWDLGMTKRKAKELFSELTPHDFYNILFDLVSNSDFNVFYEEFGERFKEKSDLLKNF